jgi:hypothetical protein
MVTNEVTKVGPNEDPDGAVLGEGEIRLMLVATSATAAAGGDRPD